MSNGHVFVVPGTINDLRCDHVLIPTDYKLSVRRMWFPVLGWENDEIAERELSGIEMLSPEHRAVLLPEQDDRPRRWLIAVGAFLGDGVEWLYDGLRQTLDLVAQHPGRPALGRSRPLVAMPTLGVGGGGFGLTRGQVIAGLLATAETSAQQHGIDVVIVVNNPADYAAFQHLRRQSDHVSGLQPDLEDEAQRLAELARSGELALFMGAGVGIPAGLPSWTGLLEQLADRLGVRLTPKEWDCLGPLDSAEFLSRQIKDHTTLGALVADVIGQPQRYALSHALLASLRCRESVTTNFDQLYEKAVAAVGDEPPLILLPDTSPADVTHSTATRPRDRWLLKLHGDVAAPDNIVLDRRRFVTFDAERRPLGSVLQTVLLTRHLLVVGASLADDNVVRLIHEVRALTEKGRDSATIPKLGTVLSLGDRTPRTDLWEPEFAHANLGVGTDDRAGSARELEIFLDFVALDASSTAPYLLDERYKDLLGQDELDVAVEARALADHVAELSPGNVGRANEGWDALGDVLHSLGAGRK